MTATTQSQSHHHGDISGFINTEKSIRTLKVSLGVLGLTVAAQDVVVWLSGSVALLADTIPIFQPAHFGRVYAAYEGLFIVLSLLWGWILDANIPDRFDVVGAAMSLIGVPIIMYWPR